MAIGSKDGDSYHSEQGETITWTSARTEAVGYQHTQCKYFVQPNLALANGSLILSKLELTPTWDNRREGN